MNTHHVPSRAATSRAASERCCRTLEEKKTTAGHIGAYLGGRRKHHWGRTHDKTSENELMETEDEGDPPDGQGVEDIHTAAYIWDSMDEEDREDTMATLQLLDEWAIWKSKDKWSPLLKAAGFHQLLYTSGLWPSAQSRAPHLYSSCSPFCC